MCVCVCLCPTVFDSLSPQMVFSACQLTKDPRVVHGQTEEQRGRLFLCMSVEPFKCKCVWKTESVRVCVCGKPGTSLTGELMKTSVLDFRTNLYLSNVSSGDWESNAQSAPPSPPEDQQTWLLLHIQELNPFVLDRSSHCSRHSTE